MKNKKNMVDKKYELKFEYDDCVVIWKYDTKKTTTGPYEVEVKYYKTKK